MNDPSWRLALLAIGLAALWFWTRARRQVPANRRDAGQAARLGTPRLWPRELDAYETRTGCQRHVRAARAAVLDFESASAATFEPEAARDGPRRVRAMFLHRDHALRELREVRLRLPNDLTDEKRLASLMDTLDTDMLAVIEDARQRCGAPLVHPGPADDAWYGTWYRAANDVVL